MVRMRERTLLIFGLLFGLAWWTAIEATPSEQRGLLIRHSDEKGLTFDYVLPELEEIHLSIADQEYTILRLADFGYTEQVGAPQLPSLRLLVGLPLEGNAQVTIVDTDVEEKMYSRIAPVPTLVRHIEDESILTREKYMPDPDFYTTDGFYPQQVVEIEKPSFLRNQRVAGVILRPVQFNPVTGKLRIHSKVTVGVRFENSGLEQPLPRRESGDLFEGVYQKVLVNYETARTWRRQRRPGRAKRSVFQEGQDWYKIEVREDGIYSLNYNDLSDVGINVADFDPRTIRMFSGGGRELPRTLSDPRPDSLTELSIVVGGEEDGSFDPGDYILFYGQDLSGWDYDPEQDTYSHYFNHYTDDNIYWLTFGSGESHGKRMTSRDGSLHAAHPLHLESFRHRIHEEHEVTNPSHSGLNWFWRTFSGGETKVFQVDLPGAISDSLCSITMRLKGKTEKELGFHEVKIYFNSHRIAHATFHNDRELLLREEGRGWVVDGTNEVRVEHIRQPGSDSSLRDQIYFDWYEIRFWSRFEVQDEECTFSSPRGSDVAEYSLAGFSRDSVSVYDITDPFDVVRIENLTEGQTVRFQDHQDLHVERRYIALEPEKVKEPVDIVQAELEGLRTSTRGADYLIITHEDFVSDVEPLRAHRQNVDGFFATVVKTSAIYDEFSWGLFDPTAVRDFVKYTFDNWDPVPAYLLFVGDGHYDFKNYTLTSRRNWIPPYESGGETYDDWFVYVDEDPEPDMSTGRLPAQSSREVQDMVRKIIEYDTQPELGPWRNRVLLLADDELQGCNYVSKDHSWNTVHTKDSERISDQSIPGNFEQGKVYLMEYELDQNCHKTAATEDILSDVNNGIVLWNYIGHGGHEVMADERAIYSPRDLARIRNEGRPFLLAAFTCDLGVFDQPAEESMAEDLVRLDERGAIATIAATRGTSSGPNFVLSQRFYSNLFFGDIGFGETSTFGEALFEAKVKASTQSTVRLYLLFGDPAQRLRVPRYEVVVTRLEPDTLQALETIVLEAEMVRTDSTVLSDFEGTALLSVFDSFKPRVHVTPDGDQEVHYQLPGAILYRGIVSVVDGSFQTQFVIPKDITYGGQTGRISVYVSNDAIDGVGYQDALPMTGGSVEVVDSVGPTICMTILGREDTFTEGDYVRDGEVLKTTFFDNSGINMTGEPGHWIVLQKDGDSRTRENITPAFVYDEGSYQKGSVEYELKDVTPGEHTIEIKAWDNYNNASVQSLFLRVVASGDFQILNVMNYPNPLSRETTFIYELTGSANDVNIKIYTVAGRLVKILRNLPGDIGFNQTAWEAFDEDGDRLANGVYLYKVIATGDNGTHREQIGRLIVMR